MGMPVLQIMSTMPWETFLAVIALSETVSGQLDGIFLVVEL